MAGNTVTPMVLNNSVYMQSVEFDVNTHLDSSHLMKNNAGKSYMTDLGIIQPFVTSGYLMKPYLYDMSGIKKPKIYVDGQMFKWSTPLAEEPCYIVGDISGLDRPGAAGEKFKIKINRRKFDHGHIIGVDPHSADQLLITEDEIYTEGDSTVYTVRYLGVDQGKRHFPKQFLKPGVKLFAITSVETEYSTTYTSLPPISGGMRDHFNVVGTYPAQITFSITREAAYKRISNKVTDSLKAYKKILEMYIFNPGSLGHDLSLMGQKPNTISKHYSSKYGKHAEKMMSGDIAYRSWVPLMEAIGYRTLEMYIENEAMFGSGGKIRYDGKTEVQRTLGLFHQLNMGNQHNYNLYNWTLEKFEFILASRLINRVEKYQGNVIKIKTGYGGLAWIQNMLRNQPQKQGMVLQGNDYIEGIGKSNNQKLKWTNPNFVGWEMANGLGAIEFELAPGLDPVDANELINPMVPVSKGIGGHRLSSYMFIIDDITNTGDNVVELVCKEDWDVNHSVHQGKLAYPFTTFNGGSWARGSNHPGFQVYMSKRHKAYWVKDTTKSLIIKPINPFTGRPLYDGFYK